MMMMMEKKTCTNSVVHSIGSHLEPKLEPTKHLLELGDQTPRNPSQKLGDAKEGEGEWGRCKWEPREEQLGFYPKPLIYSAPNPNLGGTNPPLKVQRTNY